MSDTELSDGDFIRIDWPNGSSLSGVVKLHENGAIRIGFGPEDSEEMRWIMIGWKSDLHDFVNLGSLQILSHESGVR